MSQNNKWAAWQQLGKKVELTTKTVKKLEVELTESVNEISDDLVDIVKPTPVKKGKKVNE